MRGHYLRGRGGSGGWHGGRWTEHWPIYVQPYPYCYPGLDPECIPETESIGGDMYGEIEAHPREQRVHLFGNVFVTIRRSPDGHWTAETEIPTAYGGPIRLSASVHERVIANAFGRMTRSQIARAIRNARRTESETMAAGGIFDDIGKAFNTAVDAVSSVAKTKVFQDVAKGVSDVAKNPIVQGAMSILPGGSLINQGLQQTSHAASLLAKAKGGDEAAREGIRGIQSLAAAGNPKAKASMDLLSEMNRNPLSFMPGGGGASRSAAAAASTIAGLDLGTLQALAQPASSLGPDAVARGASLLARAHGGDTSARQALMGLAQKAQAGDPRASEIAGMLRAVAQNSSTLAGGVGVPMPRAVLDPEYASMVRRYHGAAPVLDMHAGADGVFRPRKPLRRRVHPLRGHSITYGLPLRVR